MRVIDRRRFCRAGIVVALFLSASTVSLAQGIEIVHAFQTLPANPVGDLLELGPNLFLGASRTGGAHDLGTIYALGRRTDGTWTTSVIHSFSGSEGSKPGAGLIRARDGNFYGTTERGGAFNLGAVFRMSASGVVTRLHSFSEPNGVFPLAPLVQAGDGSLWGTTSAHAAGGGSGTIFKISASGTYSQVHSFGGATGSGPTGALVLGADGRLYGVTDIGGSALMGGALFRLTTAGTATVLHYFDRLGPKWLRRGIDGHIYGVTFQGGDAGVFFRVTTTGSYTPIQSFDSGVFSPHTAPIQRPDGSFYGGASSLDAASRHVDVIYRMTLTEKAQPIATLGGAFGEFVSGVIAASDGTLVGTTLRGERPLPEAEPLYGLGVAFSVRPSAPSPALLYAFGSTRAQGPAGRLTEGADGRLYGTTCYGGLYNRGTVYRLDSTGPTTLHSFSGPDGACPMSGVTRGADGAFYGTTVVGYIIGYINHGRIFKVTADGAFTELWRPPPGDLGYLFAAPTPGLDGQLYVPASGLKQAGGGVLRVGLDGTVTLLTNMQHHITGSWPGSPLTLASDGQFYGTTWTPAGGIYRMDTNGALGGVHLFPNADDADAIAVRGGVIEGADGRLYGSILQGGAAQTGAVYASTLAGDVAILHEFNGSDSAFPWGELLEIAPGRFIGVTLGLENPAFGLHGSIFEVTADGGFATLHRFSYTDGATPFATLMRASDGTIYGSTLRGGPLGGGVIFRIVP